MSTENVRQDVYVRTANQSHERRRLPVLSGPARIEIGVWLVFLAILLTYVETLTS